MVTTSIKPRILIINCFIETVLNLTYVIQFSISVQIDPHKKSMLFEKEHTFSFLVS